MDIDSKPYKLDMISFVWKSHKQILSDALARIRLVHPNVFALGMNEQTLEIQAWIQFDEEYSGRCDQPVDSIKEAYKWLNEGWSVGPESSERPKDLNWVAF